MYVITKPNKWEEYLHLVEFSYNNGYQTSAKLSPFEILYDRKCTTLISKLIDNVGGVGDTGLIPFPQEKNSLIWGVVFVCSIALTS